MKGTRGEDPARWRTDPARRPRSADLILRGARRPRLPGTGELERLGARIDEIPRLSAARARRWARVTSAAAGIGLAVLATGVWAWRGGPRPGVAAPTKATSGAARTPAAGPVTALLAAPAATAPAPPPLLEDDGAPIAPSATAAPAARRIARFGTPRPVHHERSTRAAAGLPSAAIADTLAREIALVDGARGDLTSTPARALAALDTHRREFPHGQLAAEREFLAVEALRRTNRIDEARQRATELREHYPMSSYAARAARLLQSAP